MSSIDKGVERVVHEMGRNIRVERRGNVIYGFSNGEIVFSLADRYGYINEEEKKTVRRQIASYDSRKNIERLRELERIRLEKLRKEAINEVKNNVNAKLSQINNDKLKDNSLINNVYNSYNTIINKLLKVQESSSLFNITSLITEIKKSRDKAHDEGQKVLGEYNTIVSELNKLNNQIKDSMDVSSAKDLNKKVSKFNIRIKSNYDCSFDLDKTNKESDLIIEEINKISNLAKDLEITSKGVNEEALIAKEAINTIKAIKISSMKDVQKIAVVMENGYEAIKSIYVVENRENAIKDILELEGKIASCKKLQDIEVKGTYEAIEYRSKIVTEANEVIEKFSSLQRNEFTTCSNERINEVITRATNVIKGSDSSESVYNEMNSLLEEYQEIIQKDSIEVKNYQEYQELKNKLIEYGVDSKEIPAFNYQNYKEIKEQLATMISIEKRNQQKTNMYLTNIETTKTMLEMGYELFATSGDKNGLVVESLFTKKGYDGVIWQIVVLADGSFNRRLLGVNKGETQTSVEYIKEVAKELDESNESIEFLKKFNESTGSSAQVTKAIEYNSKEVEKEIAQNGYFYLKGEALENYNKQVKEENNVVSKKQSIKVSQVSVTKGNQIKNSATNLSQSLKKSMAMSV